MVDLVGKLKRESNLNTIVSKINANANIKGGLMAINYTKDFSVGKDNIDYDVQITSLERKIVTSRLF